METDEFSFHITDRCNLRCVDCCQATGLFEAQPTEMPLRTFRRFQQLLYNHKFYKTRLAGGEPTLHPEFPGFCAFIRRVVSAQVYDVVTNGAGLLKHWDAAQTLDTITLDHYIGRNDDVVNEIMQKGSPKVILQVWKPGEHTPMLPLPNYSGRPPEALEAWRQCYAPRVLYTDGHRIYRCCGARGVCAIRHVSNEPFSVPAIPYWDKPLEKVDLVPLCRICGWEAKRLNDLFGPSGTPPPQS